MGKNGFQCMREILYCIPRYELEKYCSVSKRKHLYNFDVIFQYLLPCDDNTFGRIFGKRKKKW